MKENKYIIDNTDKLILLSLHKCKKAKLLLLGLWNETITIKKIITAHVWDVCRR